MSRWPWPVRFPLRRSARWFDTRKSRLKLAVEVLEDRTAPSIFIPVTNHRDLVYDALRNTLYITASDGTVQRYNTVSQSLLSAWQVGTSLNGADITADDSSLYVADGSLAIVHKVNLASGAVTDLTYTSVSGELGAWDVAISANGKGFVTTQFGGSSGQNPLRQIDTSTDALSIRTDDPGSGGNGKIGKNSLLARSADRSLLTLTESGISDGRAMTYSAASDSFPVFSDTGMFLDNRLAAISRDGSLIAVEGSSSITALANCLMVADRNFHGVVSLQGIDGGAVFDPTNDVLYGVNSHANQVIAFDTHTWAVKYVLSIGEIMSPCMAFGSGVMRVSDDGKLLFLASPSGVWMFNLPVSTGVASSLSLAGFPSFVTAGTSASFTVTALDPAANVATGYTGTVTFASTDAAAILPNTYTFTASDHGVHTFTATLKTAGTQSLSVSDSVKLFGGTQGGIVVHVVGASLIPVKTHRDLVFDAQRQILHITTSSGTIERYDLASGDLLSPFQFIDPLNGGDITANGNALYVADGQRNLSQGFFDKVDLTTGNLSRLTYDLAGAVSFEDAAWDLAFGPGNLGLATTQVPGGSGWILLRQLDTSTDTFSVRTDDPGVQVRENTSVRRGADRSEFILTEPNITSGPFFSYNAVTNKFSSRAVNINTFLDNQPSAVNRNGTLLALDVPNSGITIYDPNLNVLKVLTGVDGGMLFDPLRDLLYITSNNIVVAYNTNTWAAVFSVDIGETLGTLQTFGNGTMTISNDGQWLFINTPSGVRIMNVPATVTSFSISGLPASTQAGTAQSFTLTAVDNLGHTATNYTGTVHFTGTDSQAVLPVDYTFSPADNGVHTFTTTLKTAGTQAIMATDSANGITISQNITVNPAAASHFAVSAPASATAGSAFNFTLTAQDAFNNTATGYAGTVHFTSSDSQATLPANSTLSNGTGSFSATLKTAGSRTITAKDTVSFSITGTSNSIVVNAAAASHFALSAPGSATAGTAFSFTIKAQDQFNNTATGYTGTVHFTSSDGQATLPADSTLSNGAGSFNMTLKTAGTQTIAATDTASSSITGTSNGIVVNPAAASHFVVSAPASATAGTTFSFTVTAQDAFNNTATGYAGTVHFTSSDGQATLPANGTLTNGTKSFSATLKTAGNQTITATDTVSSSNTGISNRIVVNPAAATHFAVNGPTSVTAGSAFSFTVTAQDQFSNTATSYSGTVHFSSSDNQAVLPADSSLSNGTGAFSATLKTATNLPPTSQSLTATDTVISSITGSQTNITVNPGPTTSFGISDVPLFPTAGVAFSFHLITKDNYGNVGASYFGTVHFTSSDPQAVLPADYTFTSADQGQFPIFPATFRTAGEQTITATDTVDSTITGTSSSSFVSAAAASHFAMSAPGSTMVGTAFSFTVTAQDAFNNTATGYGGTVHFTSSGQAVLPGDSTLSSGTGSFSATLKTAGNQTITATDTVSSSITGTSNSILVSAPVVTHFAVSAPANVTAGSAFSFTITAQDQFNNTVTGYTGTVHFTTSAVKAILPANYTFTSADAGIHNFSATLRSAGTQSITVTDTANSSIAGTQSGIVVNPAAPFKLAIARFPSKPTAGVAGSFRVTAQDMFSNTTLSFADKVHFTSSDPKAVLPDDYTFTSGDAGVHDFMATLKIAGSQSITVQDSSNTVIISATQSNILVQSAAASTLQVSGFPSSIIAGTSHDFSVTAFDPYGNAASGYRGTIRFTSSDNQAVLPANYSFTSGDAGAHGFSATLNTPGNNQSITATDTVNPGITSMETGIAVVSMQPTAGISGPPLNASGSNGVPGQPLPFTLTATESGLPPDTVYAYQVQWGDGSPTQTFMGASGLQVTHPFPGSTSYTISVTAADPNSNGSLPASTSVSLTALALEPDPANSSQTALFVGGTTGADTIAITPAVRTVNGNLDYGVKASMNMVNYGSFFAVSRVVVYAQAGADIIKTAAQTINGVFTNVSVPVMFFSGGDNDILNLTGSGSNAGTVAPNDVLVGGGGTDRLIGGQGRDILIGGAGLSTFQAGSGGDLLIGGTTTYDNNAAALAAILAEWSRTDISYTARMDHLTGKTSGGLNGNSLLITKMGNANTVFDNGLKDSLQGGAGMDWFFAGMADVILNTSNGEVVTQL